MDQYETEFLETQKHKLLVWFRYIDDVFFFCNYGKEKLSLFLEDLKEFHPNFKFFHETNKELNLLVTQNETIFAYIVKQ